MEPVTCGRFLRILFSSVLLIATGLGFASPASSAEPSLEYQVKAVFLLNFTKFIEWPATAFAQPDSPIAICIVGNDPFGSALDQIVGGEVVKGRKVTVQRISHVPVPKSCQLLFVGKSDNQAQPALSGLDSGVLTVGEGDGFVRSGGMIGFVVENRRVRFDINQAAASGAGLKLSSQLLKVARSVER